LEFAAEGSTNPIPREWPKKKTNPVKPALLTLVFRQEKKISGLPLV
jgi:hypothetical protein